MNDKPFFAYRSFWKEHETMKRFYDAGIRQFCVFPANTTNSVGEPYCQYPINWKGYDKYDFSVVDEQFEDLLKVAPDAKILCMLDLNSPNWLVKNLNCAGILADSFLALTDALSAQRWVEATKNYLKALIGHIEAKYGDRILTYLLAAGTTDEWMDYSKGRETAGKLERYQNWCKDHGLDIPSNIPVWNERFNISHLPCLRDPEIDKNALQYWKFHSDLVAEGIIDFSGFVRGLVPDCRKIGVFYGYILQLNASRLVQCGHLAYEKVLAANSIDYVTSPGIYDDRAMGGGGGFMNVNGTVKLHGKSYFHEIDHATYTSNWELNEYVKLEWMINWPDEKASIAGLRREFCRSLLHGSSLWWFDMWGGFYKSQKLVDEIGKFQKLWDKYADYDIEPEAEIAIIVDPESTFYIEDGCNDSITKDLYTSLLSYCNRLGTSYKAYSFNDIENIPNLEQYKMIFFPGLFEVSAEKRAILDKYILKNNRTIIWSYSAGIINGKQWQTENMEQLTGISYGTSVHKEINMGSWKSVYFPKTDDMSPEMLRAYAEKAGVHIFVDASLPVFVTNNFLMAHSAKSGVQIIKLKQAARVTELLDGKFTKSECHEFEYCFDGPETVLFEIKKIK